MNHNPCTAPLCLKIRGQQHMVPYPSNKTDEAIIYVPALTLTILNENISDAYFKAIGTERTKTFFLTDLPPQTYELSSSEAEKINLNIEQGQNPSALEVLSLLKRGHSSYGTRCVNLWLPASPFPGRGLIFLARVIDGAIDSHLSQFTVEVLGVPDPVLTPPV